MAFLWWSIFLKEQNLNDMKYILFYSEPHLVSDSGKKLTRNDSWNDEAWYCAYLAIVVCDLLLSQRQIFFVPVESQFSSAGCNSCVRTSTKCSLFASTKVLVENRPRSKIKT